MSHGTTLTTSNIRAIAARITFDEGTPTTIHGLPATMFCGDNGIVRVGQAGMRTVVTVTRFGIETARTFIGPAGAEDFIASIAG